MFGLNQFFLQKLNKCLLKKEKNEDVIIKQLKSGYTVTL